MLETLSANLRGTAGICFSWSMPGRMKVALGSIERRQFVRTRKTGSPVEIARLNVIEITNVSVRRFGPFCWVKVEANFRHIGETPVLFEKRKQTAGSEPQRAAAAYAA